MSDCEAEATPNAFPCHSAWVPFIPRDRSPRFLLIAAIAFLLLSVIATARLPTADPLHWSTSMWATTAITSAMAAGYLALGAGFSRPPGGS